MAAADLRPGEREESLASIPPPDLKAGEREEPIDAGPRTIGKPADKGMIQRLAELSIPPRSLGDIGEKVQTGLHLLPYAAAAAGPEGIAAGAAVQGVTGAAEEFGVQTIDHLTGKRKEYDWPAVAWNAGWNTVAAAAGGWIGKQVGSRTGKLAAQAPKVQELIAAGETVTPKRIAGIAQQASDELKSKTMLDSLGQKLGMTEEQSAKLTNAYDEGRQVGDAVFQTDRMIQGEFKQRYDAILGPHNATPVDQSAINASIDGSAQWTQQHGMEGHIRPPIGSLLDKIKGGEAPPIEDMQSAMEYLSKSKIPLPAKATPDQLIDIANKAQMAEQGASMDVVKARGWLSVLRRIERTQNLTEAEESVVAKTSKAINRTIADVLKTADPKGAEKLASADASYGVFSSNFRDVWKALKDKKSLSEVGDGVYNLYGTRPDALRYLLQGADRAGRMDDMRSAFLNKMWRESQTAGGATERAKALNAYVAKFAPGSKGQDILQTILGKQPGVTDSVGQFATRIEDMRKAADVLKNPATPNRIRRVLEYRLAFGLMAGGAISYGAMRKDPVEGLAVGLGLWAGIGGMMAAAKNPALNRMWVEWITTNPNASAFIERGARLLAQAAKDDIKPAGGDSAAASPDNR